MLQLKIPHAATKRFLMQHLRPGTAKKKNKKKTKNIEDTLSKSIKYCSDKQCGWGWGDEEVRQLAGPDEHRKYQELGNRCSRWDSPSRLQFLEG